MNNGLNDLVLALEDQASNDDGRISLLQSPADVVTSAHLGLDESASQARPCATVVVQAAPMTSLVHSHRLGNAAWEIDLSEFKKGGRKRSSRAPRPCRNALNAPLVPLRQLAKEGLPVVELDPGCSMAARPEDISTRKVLDVQRWYVCMVHVFPS